MSHAEDLIARGEYAKALVELHALRQAESSDARIDLAMGVALLRRGEVDRAEPHLERYLERVRDGEPADAAEVLVALGDVYRRRDEYERAMAAFTAAREHLPHDGELWTRCLVGLAALAGMRGDYDEGLALAHTATTTKHATASAHVAAHLAIANCHRGHGEPLAAERAARTAINLAAKLPRELAEAYIAYARLVGEAEGTLDTIALDAPAVMLARAQELLREHGSLADLERIREAFQRFGRRATDRVTANQIRSVIDELRRARATISRETHRLVDAVQLSAPHLIPNAAETEREIDASLQTMSTAEGRALTATQAMISERETIRILLDLVRTLNQLDDYKKLLAESCRMAAQLTGADRALVAIANRAGVLEVRESLHIAELEDLTRRPSSPDPRSSSPDMLRPSSPDMLRPSSPDMLRPSSPDMRASSPSSRDSSSDLIPSLSRTARESASGVARESPAERSRSSRDSSEVTRPFSPDPSITSPSSSDSSPDPTRRSSPDLRTSSASSRDSAADLMPSLARSPRDSASDPTRPSSPDLRTSSADLRPSSPDLRSSSRDSAADLIPSLSRSSRDSAADLMQPSSPDLLRPSSPDLRPSSPDLSRPTPTYLSRPTPTDLSRPTPPYLSRPTPWPEPSRPSVPEIDPHADTPWRRALDQVLQTRRPTLVESETATARDGEDLHLGSALVAPLRAGNHIIGAIYVDKELCGGVFTSQDLDLLALFAAQVSTMLQNVRSSEELRLAARSRAATLEAISDGVLSLDRAGLVTSINARAARILGVAPNAKPNLALFPDLGFLRAILERGEEIDGRVSRIGAAEYVINARIVRSDQRDVAGVVVTLTEMKRAKSIAQRIAGSHARYSFTDLIGEAATLRGQLKIAEAASRSDSTVLITGESGTGKEVIAQAIHNASARTAGPFVGINCSAIPRELLESELFGYESGAFTGARRGGQPGKFELAEGGTILLDEIGDMPLEMQAKLLRVLQERRVRRIGAAREVSVDARVIATTNRDLDDAAAHAQFRADLLFRLKVIHIALPSLRERATDIPILVEHFLRLFSARLGKQVRAVAPGVMAAFQRYGWPGNIRELENVLEAEVNLIDPEAELLDHVPENLRKGAAASTKRATQTFEESERELLVQALTRHGGSIPDVARTLGISRGTVYNKLNRYGIDPDVYRDPDR